MGKIFLDIETQDWSKYMTLAEMKISYCGVILEDNQEIDIWESDMEKLKELLEKAQYTVGYNILGFDMPIIGNYLGEWVNDLPQIDLMVALQKQLGYRPKLDVVTSATLGHGKNDHGENAPKYFANGEFDKLKNYCLEDVRITKNLYEFGLEKGFVKYFDKYGFLRETKIDWNDGIKLPPPKNEYISMF